MRDVATGVTVRDALVQGRQAVARALALGATSGPEPDEETLSWLLQSTAAWSSDRITVRRFNRHEESHYTGADWLWWWEGAPDEWFGCLVQAKRLIVGPAGLTFGFDYRTGASTANPDPPFQIQRLLDAADALEVPAAYILYRSPVLGSAEPWSCPTVEPDWDTAAATFVAAAVVNEWHWYARHADLSATRPIECLACEGLCGNDLAVLSWYAHSLADPSVRRILTAPPTTAARRAFRALFSEVVRLRATQFRGQAPDVADQMHSGFLLGEHFARGVRQPPWYAASVLSEGDLEDAPDLDQAAGVVIVSDG